jgi:hypothetical protein
MLIFFASTLAGPSMHMLSIEKGKVYTESFSLNHIIKSFCSSATENCKVIQATFGSSRNLAHRHIKLTVSTIPEKRFFPTGLVIFYTGSDFLPTYQAISHLTALLSYKKHFQQSGQLKLPIPPLLQSSVLLI